MRNFHRPDKLERNCFADVDPGPSEGLVSAKKLLLKILLFGSLPSILTKHFFTEEPTLGHAGIPLRSNRIKTA